MSHPERRRIRRNSAHTICPLLLRPQGGTVLSAHAVDFSVTGMGILIDMALEPGAIVTLERDRPGRRFSITAEVRHVSKVAKDQWLLGCEFQRLLSADDLMAIG